MRGEESQKNPRKGWVSLDSGFVYDGQLTLEKDFVPDNFVQRLKHLLRAVFDVHCINGLHKVIVDFQGLLIRTKLLGMK